MQRKNSKYLIPLLCLCCLSCERDDTELRQQMIERQIQDRLQNYMEVEKRRCMAKVMEEASALADSLLRANPVFITLDSLQRPPVPSRPDRPEFERRKDSIKIEPIIPEKEAKNE